MNILACIKHVPDTETRVKVASGGNALDLGEANWVVNPYDEFAVEAALQLKEKQGGGTVTVLSVGNDEAVKSLRQALAMGADKAVLCNDPCFEGSDAKGIAKILAEAIKKAPFDIIFFGKHAVGDDNQQVGSLVASLLNIPVVTVVTAIDYGEAGVVRCHREVEGGVEVVKAPMPCAITCQKGLNEPRYPSLKGIMAAKKKEVTVFKAADLGIDPAQVGKAGAAFAVKGYELPPPRPEGRVLGGEIDAQVKELVHLLHDEAKVI
ncbi:MAG: electron transfer flavoprotein subunit beta/FixA family protein [Acidobacteria bacterium]|jgi:electron transfer flavoprotein beta subunit|nr:electron transfer flavoprotein subunit beta/FixA family protein [Acidobacteriota bacterium]